MPDEEQLLGISLVKTRITDEIGLVEVAAENESHRDCAGDAMDLSFFGQPDVSNLKKILMKILIDGWRWQVE